MICIVNCKYKPHNIFCAVEILWLAIVLKPKEAHWLVGFYILHCVIKRHAADEVRTMNTHLIEINYRT